MMNKFEATVMFCRKQSLRITWSENVSNPEISKTRNKETWLVEFDTQKTLKVSWTEESNE